jgi:hypothetical protein
MFGQFLVGGARYSQRFSRPADLSHSVGFVVFQPGLGASILLNARWSVRLRADLRLAASGGEATGAWLLGGGIVRYWGRQ